MSLTNKKDFAVIIRVKNANPNGDPLSENRPRITADGYGEMTDVCLKRKIRNRLMDRGIDIFVQSDDNNIDGFASLRERFEKSLTAEQRKNGEAACEKWFDVRAFGQVFAIPGARSGEGVSIGIRGPVSIQSAFSIKPVSITSVQITKSVSGESGAKKGSDTMGMKHRIDSGIYVFFGSMNPQLAVKTGFSDDDAKVIKEILPSLFENDASSARPEGSMEVLNVVWWEHNCPSGQASSAKVHNSLRLEETEDFNPVLSFDPAKGPDDADINWPRPVVLNGI